jgi:hypothetical protein
VAYRPTALGGRTVIRAGMGMFYQPYGTMPFGSSTTNQPGFSQTTPVVGTLDGYLTPYATLSNPFQDGISQPAGAANGLNTDLGKSITFVRPNLDGPYLVRWTFAVQKEIIPNLAAEIGYVGSHGLHLAFDRDINPVPAQFLSTSPFRDQTTINTLTANVSNPFQGLLPNTNLNGSTVGLAQLLRPYPEYYGDNSLRKASDNLGSSIYHLVDMRVEKRLSHGVQFLVSYSISKMISAVSMLNPTDPAPERRIATEDRPQRLVISAGYRLPFGRGMAVAGNAPPWLNAVIGGWKVGGIWTKQTGPLLGWGNVIFYGGDLQNAPRNLDRAFDTSRFNTVSSQQLANNIRRFPSAFTNSRADGPNNVDLNLQKEFRIKEDFRLQFRMEAFNALNHTLFAGPNVTPTSAAFGKITSQANISRFIQMSLRLAW